MSPSEFKPPDPDAIRAAADAVEQLQGRGVEVLAVDVQGRNEIWIDARIAGYRDDVTGRPWDEIADGIESEHADLDLTVPVAPPTYDWMDDAVLVELEGRAITDGQ